MTGRYVRLRVHRGRGHSDVAVDADLPLAHLLPWLCEAPVDAVLDGARPLDLNGPGLAEQGVLDGADVFLVLAP